MTRRSILSAKAVNFVLSFPRGVGLPALCTWFGRWRRSQSGYGNPQARKKSVRNRAVKFFFAGSRKAPLRNSFGDQHLFFQSSVPMCFPQERPYFPLLAREFCGRLSNMIVLDSDIQMVYDNVRSFGIIGTKFLIRTKKTFFQFCFIQIGHIIPFDFLT